MLRTLKKKEAPGMDNIQAEQIKSGGEGLNWTHHKSASVIWEMAQNLDTVSVVPVHKKGDSVVCGNYHKISLLIQSTKILLRIIPERISQDRELSD